MSEKPKKRSAVAAKLREHIDAHAEAAKVDPSMGLAAPAGTPYTIPAPVVFEPVGPPPAEHRIAEPDVRPIFVAAEATGLQVTSLAVHEGLVVATCGPHVPPFDGATVAEVAAKIRAYNCKLCGTGGGHNPNCEAKPR